MLSDDELVEQILLGNENAAEELIKRYYTSILRYCRWHCSNLEKAEDLTQETFLKLFKNLSGYKGKKKFKAYVYTIANHLCIDETIKPIFYLNPFQFAIPLLSDLSDFWNCFLYSSKFSYHHQLSKDEVRKNIFVRNLRIDNTACKMQYLGIEKIVWCGKYYSKRRKR